MNRRIATTVFALASAFCLTAASHAAGPGPHSSNTTTVTAPGTPAKAKVKMISFSLRNASKGPLVLQIGEQQITVAVGETASLKIQQGLQIVTVNATTLLAAGRVVSMVDTNLQGNTLVVS